MQYRTLGRTGIQVSRLCFGVLTMGPLQENLDIEEGAELIRYAWAKGLNFLDTAEIYQTYPYIKKALQKKSIRPVICSKSYAVSWQEMKESVERARDEMQVSEIDIFLLHEQENALTLKGHQGAVEFLIEARKKGIIKALGLSTHSIAGVMAGAEHPAIDIIHPLINSRGIGIMDGTAQSMAAAISYAAIKGKGIYAMKVLGGGNLLNQAHSAFCFALNIPVLSSMAVGMKNRDEIDLNIAWLEGRRNPELEARVQGYKRRLHIESWCQGCGSCLDLCRYGALSIIDQRAEVDSSLCVFCGYCASGCPDFCIRVI
ncbi:MAG: aldo/keto reductase [Chitinophagales bacterium]